MTDRTANTVADFFLAYARSHGDYLTNLKLQKLLYYAQGWHLAIFGKPLFKENLEAWVHGPAVPAVYRRFKPFKWNPIGKPVEEPRFHPTTKAFLEEVFERYGSFSALDLERMTHEETPWKAARENLPPDQNSERVLALGVMKEYFKSKLKHSHAG